MVDLHAKFEVSSSNHTQDVEGVQNFKSMSCHPYQTLFDLIFKAAYRLKILIAIHRAIKIINRD